LVEVQVDAEPDYFSRMLYGTSRLITEYLQKGDTYLKVKKVYSVNILYFNLGQGEDYIYHGTTSFIGMHKHDKLDLTSKQKELYRHQCVHEIYPEYYLLKVNQFNDVAKDTLDEWIYFLKNDAIKNSFRAQGLAEANDKLNEMKLTDQERQAYTRYLDGLHLDASLIETNYSVGKIDGEKIGIEKGKVEGRVEEKLAMAKKMKQAGMPNEAIQHITELTAVEIEKLL
jgi:predicted transposase/invertase (TIGR01784 family)